MKLFGLGKEKMRCDVWWFKWNINDKKEVYGRDIRL